MVSGKVMPKRNKQYTTAQPTTAKAATIKKMLKEAENRQMKFFLVIDVADNDHPHNDHQSGADEWAINLAVTRHEVNT
jgi:hypothetical protein